MDIFQLFDSQKEKIIRGLFALAGVGVTSLYAMWQSKRVWLNRKNDKIIHASLNTVQNNTLILDTIFEEPISEIIPNRYAEKIVRDAGKKTTPDQPFIFIENEQERWLVLNQLRLSLAETYTQGTWMSIRKKTEPVLFWFALTFERHSNIKQQKFRIMVIEEQTLSQCSLEELKFEVPWHKDRVSVLMKMKEEILTNRERFLDMSEHCMNVRIYI